MENRAANIKRTKLFFTLAILSIFLISIILFAIWHHLFSYHDSDVRKADLSEAASGKYDCIFLSMLDPANFSGEDFVVYRGISAYKADHRFQNLRDLNNFLHTCKDNASNIYLVVDCISIGQDYGFHASLYSREYNSQLLSIIQSTPTTSYEILLPYYSRDYWCSLNDTDTEKALKTLNDFINIFGHESNVTIYYMGDNEWLTANPDNYTAPNTCNSEITKSILLTTFSDENCILTHDNINEKLDKVRSIRKGISTYELLDTEVVARIGDLSNCDVVFFGDSVIGNYSDSSSIPGVLAGLTGAHTYNLGLGGTSASSFGDSWNLNRIIDAFISGDSTGFVEDEQPIYGMQKYLDDHNDSCSRELCFIINYGLNDYFGGFPIGNENDTGTDTYSGALVRAVSTLKSAFPECRIIIMTPNYCSYFSEGTQPKSETGGTLKEYVEAIIKVSGATGTEYIDNYNLGINKANQEKYLVDGCHPNEAGRYIIGTKIAYYLIEHK